MVDMGLILFKVQLSVTVKGDTLEASLVFENSTSTDLYLDGMTLCWKNKIDRDMFVIINKNGKRVDYTESIKNRKISHEDFLLLNKGDQFKAVVNINDAYDVQKGKTYKIQYSTYNPASYYPEDSTLIKMESNEIEVTF
jgi:hypothetical protein